MESLNNFMSINLINFKDHSLSVFELILVVLIFIVTKLVLWAVKKTIDKKAKSVNLDEGSSFALFQLIKYIVWIVSFVLILDTVGIQPSLILAGSAALLVGIGLGLQQTFNDILSGIILLYEKSVKVGDILDIDGEVVIIQKIGIRTSKGMSRRDISILIPNSLITTNKVINWSHQAKKTIFSFDVGVAYASDVKLVVKILEESARAHEDVLTDSLIQARLINFGSSSLDFRILFCSEKIFRIEKVKSDIRLIICEKFEENGVTIPFPQLDLHLKKG